MTDLTDRLNAAMQPVGAPTGAPTTEVDDAAAWSITGLETAAWASRKAAEARRAIARVEAWAEVEVARIRAIVTTEAQRFENDAAFFEGHLAAYLAAEIAAGRKTKSLELPGGTIKLTARQPKVDVDAEAFIAWAQTTRPDLVRTKFEPDKTALKKAAVLADDGVVVIDGEIVPGAKWEPQEDSASFVVAEEVTP